MATHAAAALDRIFIDALLSCELPFRDEGYEDGFQFVKRFLKWSFTRFPGRCESVRSSPFVAGAAFGHPP